MADTKQQVRAILDQLPDDCSVGDVQYNLYVIEKLRRRIELANDPDQCVSQTEAEARVEKWLLN